MKANDLIRKTLINRVKSEQAIRRSRLLVKGTQKRVERSRSGEKASSNPRTPIAIGSFLSMREQARKARIQSGQAIAKSRGTGQRKAK